MQPVFYNTKLTQQLLKKSDFLGMELRFMQ